MRSLIGDIVDRRGMFLIAELSANHHGNLAKARHLIDLAKQSGADAVKIQTLTADWMTLNVDSADFRIQEGLWAGLNLYDLYQQVALPLDWHEELFSYASDQDIILFSSPFSSEAVEFLEGLNCPIYKIASFEILDLELIKCAASTGKPLIMSTGLATFDEISESVEVAIASGCKDLTLLHCVSAYPASRAQFNLATLVKLKNSFGCRIGLSDHSLSNEAAVGSCFLGASVFEKHFTASRKDVGPDSEFSIEPSEFLALRESLISVKEMIGSEFIRSSSEKKNKQFRRSLYFVEGLPQGSIIEKRHVRSIRPGYGLLPKFLDDVVGKRVVEDVSAGTAVSWDLLSG